MKQKSIHTDKYLYVNSYHHPYQKQPVINALLHWTVSLLHPYNLQIELNNGYENGVADQIGQVFQKY